MRLLEGAVLALCVLLAGRSAGAQESSPAPPPARPRAAPARRDPVAVEGATLLLASGAGAAIGVVLLATASEPETCGLTGCFERPDNHQRKIGTAVLGAGIGAALVGAPVLLEGLVGPVPRDSDRRSEPMLLTGAALTASANALVGLGVGYMVADPTDYADGVAAGLFVAAGCMLAIGVPLWIRGAARVKRGAEKAPKVLLGPASASLRWRF
jgi:hypothetical protein